MSDFVLDASITMAWCFPDEETPESRNLLARMRTSTVIVPAVWPLEVVNVLLIGERRRRLTAQTTAFIQLLSALSITVEAGSGTGELAVILATGSEYSLSAYDAAYLELALRRGLPLATQDERLRAAAVRAGVSVLSDDDRRSR